MGAAEPQPAAEGLGGPGGLPPQGSPGPTEQSTGISRSESPVGHLYLRKGWKLLPGLSPHTAGRLALLSCPAQCEESPALGHGPTTNPSSQEKGSQGDGPQEPKSAFMSAGSRFLRSVAPLPFPSSPCPTAGLPGATGKEQRGEKDLSESL